MFTQNVLSLKGITLSKMHTRFRQLLVYAIIFEFQISDLDTLIFSTASILLSPNIVTSIIHTFIFSTGYTWYVMNQ